MRSPRGEPARSPRAGRQSWVTREIMSVTREVALDRVDDAGGVHAVEQDRGAGVELLALGRNADDAGRPPYDRGREGVRRGRDLDGVTHGGRHVSCRSSGPCS